MGSLERGGCRDTALECDSDVCTDLGWRPTMHRCAPRRVRTEDDQM